MSLNDWLMLTSIILLIVATISGVQLLRKAIKALNQSSEEIKDQIKLIQNI
ncbi:MAG: hypothetical protein ACRCS6_00240 [Turicibacter sp.]